MDFGLLGSILDNATGGWGHFYNQEKLAQANQVKQKGILGQMGLLGQPQGVNQGPDIPDVTSLLGPAPAPAQPQPINLMDGGTQQHLAALAQINPKLAASIVSIGQAGQDDVTQGGDGIIYSKKTGGLVNRLPVHTVVNNYNTDLGAPNAPSYFPQLPNGSIPDGKGGVVNLPGLTTAIGQQAGATARAQAVYQPVKAEDGAGRPVTTTAANLAQGGPIVGRAPEAATAAGLAASNQANAAINLPALQQSSSRALNVIDGLMTDPEMKNRVGALSVLPAIPGTRGVGFDAKVDQLKGSVFLEAYNQLKGAGQITEVEGKKAEQALARLNRAQAPEDFKAALGDLKGVIQGSLSRAQGQAKGPAPVSQGGPAARMSGPGFKILSVE